MYLKIGNVILASDSDGAVSSRAMKPKLNLAVRSVDIQGYRYARNFSQRKHGLAFEFNVEVARQFSNYNEAERFLLPHLAKLASGAQGVLTYENTFGQKTRFDNAVLADVELVSEIGVSTIVKYSFVCGKYIDARILLHAQRRVLFNGKQISI